MQIFIELALEVTVLVEGGCLKQCGGEAFGESVWPDLKKWM